MGIVIEPPATPATQVEVVQPVRVWSPVTVAVYALLLGYPAGTVLALRNWRFLGLRRDARAHLIGASIFSIIFIGVLVFSPARVGRFFGLASSIAAFSYLKAKLRADIERTKTAIPNLSVEYRRWYSGLGWLALAYLVFFFTFMLVLMIALAFDLPVPD